MIVGNALRDGTYSAECGRPRAQKRGDRIQSASQPV